jgi:hypothetical protein
MPVTGFPPVLFLGWPLMMFGGVELSELAETADPVPPSNTFIPSAENLPLVRC